MENIDYKKGYAKGFKDGIESVNKWLSIEDGYPEPYRKLINQSRAYWYTHLKNKNDVKNTRTRLKNKFKKNIKKEIFCLECENYVPCRDRQCSNFMCDIDKRCFHGEINREDCPLNIK